jgi:hypothetical protein
MGNTHLSDEQVTRCAESIIINDFVNFSNEIKNHLNKCKVCALKVQEKTDLLQKKYKNKMYRNLSMVKKSQIHFGLWISVTSSILFIIAIGIALSKL